MKSPLYDRPPTKGITILDWSDHQRGLKDYMLQIDNCHSLDLTHKLTTCIPKQLACPTILTRVMMEQILFRNSGRDKNRFFKSKYNWSGKNLGYGMHCYRFEIGTPYEPIYPPLKLDYHLPAYFKSQVGLLYYPDHVHGCLEIVNLKWHRLIVFKFRDWAERVIRKHVIPRLLARIYKPKHQAKFKSCLDEVIFPRMEKVLLKKFSRKRNREEDEHPVMQDVRLLLDVVNNLVQSKYQRTDNV